MSSKMRGVGRIQGWAAVLVLLLTTACVPGYNSVVFTARSNAGVDLDLTPPVSEIGIGRSEVVIAPTFQDAQTLPVLASFSSSNSFASNFLFGVGSTFGTGEAAYNMAKLYDSKSENPQTSTGCDAEYKPRLTDYPDLPFGMDYPEPDEVKPVTFTTSTVIGLKVGWADSANTVPTSLKFGFNRKELAWTPVTLHDCGSGVTPRYRANIPSLLATLSAEGGAGVGRDGDTSANSDVKHMQYFATGLAASELSKKYGVRAAMLTRIDPANADQFDVRSGELAALQSRVDAARAVALGAIGRVTTVGLAQTARGILGEYAYSDPLDCPVLGTLPADTAAMLDDTQKADVSQRLRACVGSAGNGSDEVVSQFEEVVGKLQASIP